MTDGAQSIVDPLGDDEVVIPYRYAVTSYGADYPVDALVKRINQGSIYVPDFQRDYVWKIPQASKFIESLLLGLPVPGIFLAQDSRSGKLAVLDGLQRLRTLQYFYRQEFPKTERKFRLQRVQDEFSNRLYSELSEDDRIVLDNSIIHATIVKQDEPSEDQSSIYYIFERINTGGTPLSPQEIRTCLYFGDFVDLLSELNTLDEWRDIFGPVSARMRDQELILRFLGLLYSRDQYQRPMKSFLNKVLGHNRDLDRVSAGECTKDFVETISLVHRALGPKAFRPQRAFNAAVYDSVMIGISERIRSGSRPHDGTVASRYSELLENEEYLLSVTKSTADEDTVERRMGLAIRAFAK